MGEPPPAPLSPRALDEPRADVRPHDHAVCVYDEHEDLRAPLARFIDEGVARRELVVFVHSFPDDEEAWRFVASARPDARRLRDDQLVLVSLYREAFEAGEARIDHAHVQSVVASLVERARRQERRGVRLFVDASRIYFGEARADEWFAFETWLGRRLQAVVGLVCAYRRSDVARPDLFPEMLRTHAYRFDAPGRT